MTLYNKGRFVEEAVASVLASTLTDFELLVVDDASTDDGPERVQRFDDARIRLLRSPVNTGRGAAANRGFAAARGAFVAILDADDRMLPDRLGKQAAFLRNHADVAVCGSAARIVGHGMHTASWPAADRECRARLVFEDPVLYGSAMFRRSVLDQHGIRCDAEWRTPGMDYLIQVAVAPHGRFANLPDALTEYRIHDQNMRSGRDPVADKRLIQQRVFSMLGIPHTEQELQDHLLFHRHITGPLDAAAVKRLRAWSRKLIAWNAETRFADEAVFTTTVRGYWDQLFFILPERGFATAWAHLVAWRPLRAAHLAYLLKGTVRRWLRAGR